MPIYYLDNNRGNNANNGLSPLTPWKDLSQIPTITGATAGDAFLLADDSRWQIAHAGRVTPPTSWRGTQRNPVIIGKYSPSSQSIGQKPLIVFHENTTREQWLPNPSLNGWTYLYPTQHVNAAILIRLGDTWTANTFDMTRGDPVQSIDGRYNILSQAQTLSIYGADQGSRAIVLYAPQNVNPVDYYGEVIVSPQALGAIGLSSGRHWITVQDIAFRETGCGVLMYSNNADQTGYVVERCSMTTGGSLVTINADAGGALRGWVRDNEVRDFGAIGIHVNTGSGGAGLSYAEVCRNRIDDGVHQWSQAGIYVQARNAARESIVFVHSNEVSNCRWGTRDKGFDGCGIYLETGADGVQVFGNVIHDQYCAIQDNSGRRNFITGNLIYNVRLGLRVSNQLDVAASSDCRVDNNTFIVGDMRQQPTQWGSTQGQDYPAIWMFWHGPTHPINITARNNIFVNVGGGRARAFVGLANNFATSSISVNGNIVHGFETDFLRASDNTVPVGGPSVVHASIADPRPYLDENYSLKTPYLLDGIPMRNPLGGMGAYLQGVRLMGGRRLDPGRVPIGAFAEGRF